MDWLNYHHLYYFWTVCKEGGFTKAAEKLRISQSAVSLQVAKLEEFLGERLLDRSSRRFKLTDAGQVTLAEAEEIFQQGQDLVQYFRSGKMKTRFAIGALSGLSKNLQLKILNNIINIPEIELTLEVGDAKNLIHRLHNYQLDAVLSDFQIESSESEPLVQYEIASEPICLVSRVKKAKKEINKTFKDIYLPSKNSPTTSVLIDHISSQTPKLNMRGYIDDIAFLRLLAIETDALVAIPKIGVQKELERGELFLFHEFRKMKQNYFLIYRQKGKKHPMLSQLQRS